jgi:hypothetical protein
MALGATEKYLLLYFTDLGLCRCVLRRTRQSTKWRICLVAGHVLVRASVVVVICADNRFHGHSAVPLWLTGYRQQC